MRHRMRPGDTGHYFSRHSLTFIRQRSCTPPPGACQRRRDLPPRRERGEERAAPVVAKSTAPVPFHDTATASAASFSEATDAVA